MRQRSFGLSLGEMSESNESRSLGCRRVGGFGEMSEFKRERDHKKINIVVIKSTIKEVTFQMDAHLNSSVGTKSSFVSSGYWGWLCWLAADERKGLI